MLLSTKKAEPLGSHFEPALALLQQIAEESDLMALLVAFCDQKLKSHFKNEEGCRFDLFGVANAPTFVPGDEELFEEPLWVLEAAMANDSQRFLAFIVAHCVIVKIDTVLLYHSWISRMY
ncbi:hypothetical protein BJ742DRAFT_744036 [Cladochytrium replicatum]|nr:hypothetical protein BJ742DRAFT_744036 [Cladochytrium replicatum]